MNSCEWGVETGEINGFNLYGHDVESLLSFDLQTVTWIATSPQAVTTKLRWEAEKAQFEYVCVFHFSGANENIIIKLDKTLNCSGCNTTV